MKQAKRKAQSKGKAVYSIITRSLVSESGRFLPQPRGAALLAKCKMSDNGGYCSTEYAPNETLELIREYDEALATLENYADFTEDAALKDLAKNFREELKKEYDLQARQKARDDAARLKDNYTENSEPLWVCGDLAALDVTGLDADDSRMLALLLAKWNKKAKKVYTRRNGQRFIGVHCNQINHPFIEIMPFYDDLQNMYKRGEYENVRR
jgi:hypothetical protein